MSAVGDEALANLLDEGLLDPCPTASKPTDEGTIDTRTRAAGVALNVGRIRVPSDDGISPPIEDTAYRVPPGGTVVIETAETIKLSDKYVGVVFARPSISARGLLLTNPGLVDPGYRGRLHFTVINMSTKDIPLNADAEGPEEQRSLAVMTLFEVSNVNYGWLARLMAKQGTTDEDVALAQHAKSQVTGPLASLGSDFLSVKSRAREAAHDQISRDTTRVSTLLAILFVVVTIVGTVVANLTTGNGAVERLNTQISQLQHDLDALKAANPNARGGSAGAAVPGPSAPPVASGVPVGPSPTG